MTHSGKDNPTFVFSNDIIHTTLTTNISWKLSVSYVDTPYRRIVIDQGFYVSASGWSVPEYEISTPTIIPPQKIVLSQGNVEKEISVSPSLVLGTPDFYYYSYRTSSKNNVFYRGDIKASVKLIISHAGANIPITVKDINLTF